MDFGLPRTSRSQPVSIMITTTVVSRLAHRNPPTNHLRLLCAPPYADAWGSGAAALISVQSTCPSR